MKLKDIITEVVKEGKFDDYTIALYDGQFLDRFYEEPDYNKIKDRPKHNSNVPKYVYVRMAAIAETMAHKYGFKVPKWCMESQYTFGNNEPYFFLNAEGDYRIVLILESPPEFSWRNMFVRRNTLERC